MSRQRAGMWIPVVTQINLGHRFFFCIFASLMIQGCQPLLDKKHVFLRLVPTAHPVTSNWLVVVQVICLINNDILEYCWDNMSLQLQTALEMLCSSFEFPHILLQLCHTQSQQLLPFCWPLKARPFQMNVMQNLPLCFVFALIFPHICGCFPWASWTYTC